MVCVGIGLPNGRVASKHPRIPKFAGKIKWLYYAAYQILA